jgi:hypothetical protein
MLRTALMYALSVVVGLAMLIAIEGCVGSDGDSGGDPNGGCSSISVVGDGSQASCSVGGDASNEQSNSTGDAELDSELARFCFDICEQRGNDPVNIVGGPCFEECLVEERETLEPGLAAPESDSDANDSAGDAS